MRLTLNFKLFKKYSTLKPLINLRELLVDPERLKQNALERRMTVNIDLIKELNSQRVQLSKELNALNAQRKSSVILQNGKEERKNLIKNLADIEDLLLKEVSMLPNWSSEKSPILENEIIRTVPIDFDHTAYSRADHVDICKRFDLVDFEGPARTTGAHFYALKGVTAMLEMALTSWTINRAVQRGFLPVSVPDCVRERFVVGCGFQPRRSSGSNGLPVYTINDPARGTTDDDPLVLAGTSEMFLASQHSGQTLNMTDLPLKFVGVSHCFRSEVGHHTAASRGLYRVHQFTKVELFVFSDPTASSQHFKEITDLQADLLGELNLPFRVLEMARWELGSAASRKWDHEVWMPGRKIWGEVMSTSECTDFQSRRLAIRLKHPKDKDLTFPYTLNGTACAVPRIIMGLLEWGWDPAEPEYLNLPTVLEPFYPTTNRNGINSELLTIRFR